MEYDDIKCTKSTCEKYTLRFNKGWDYAVFTIDDTGIFQCHSSFGDYAYHWTAFGDNFKEFLCRIDSGYLLCKVSDQTYFDYDKYLNKAKKTIFELRKGNDISKDEARGLWNFITDDLQDYSNSYDMVCMEIHSNKLLSKIYCGEVFYSPFSPEKDYPLNAVAFAEHIYPAFVRVLKEELKAKEQVEQLRGNIKQKSISKSV